MQIPKLEKIVLNMAVGKAVQDSKKLNSAIAEMALITGQKPYRLPGPKVGRELQAS